MAEELKLKKKTKWKNNEVPFGKHKGKKLKWVMKNDPQYLEWACYTGVEWFLKFMPDHLVRQYADDYDRVQSQFQTGAVGRRWEGSRSLQTGMEDYDYDTDYEITAYDLCVDGW